jgi:DNA-binding response OmpR family regulator
MRVLYVEDDEAMAQSVSLMLEGDGHVCEQTSHGKEAVDLAKRNDYDFILLDVMLPDIDGFEVIKQLRGAGVQTPFVFQSGLVDRNSAFGGLAFGVGEYLVKPFTKAELMTTMHTVLARSKINEIASPDGPPKGIAVEHDDRRQHRRFKTVRPALILERGGIDCKIIDMSHGGAALRLPNESSYCPPTFDLKTRDGEVYHCEVCWRLRERVGVKFV